MESLLAQLQSLSHGTRLEMFRLLLRRYPQGVPSGEIAQALGLKPNTCSVHLSSLADAGLVTSEREGTTIRYAAALPVMRAMMDDMMRGCCNNRPDLCTPAEAAGRAAPDPARAFDVLFICTGNSARSIMAEAIMNDMGQGRFRAFSAGTSPAAQPHPQVLRLLADKGHDVAHLRSKSTDEFAGPGAPDFDFVFTVCDDAANEDCPAWPGQPLTAHWGLPDPVKATGTEAERALAFRQAYALLRNRIAGFASLPFDTLGRISLQHALDDIGRRKEPA